MSLSDESLRCPAGTGSAPGALRFGHSPDPDDAFMFYGFDSGGVEVELTEGGPGGERRRRSWKVEHLLEDIQSLNERALGGELEMTAISAHAYPFVAQRYWVMRTGVSMGDGYGPIVVARGETDLAGLLGARVAIPGMMTTGALVLKFYLQTFRPVPMPFDQIMEAVAAGEVDAGVIIHEGQLTYERSGLVKVADLGQLWRAETGHPLPLGLDVVRRDLGMDLASACSVALRQSIEYAEAHAAEALAYAGKYGRDLDGGLVSRFVKMYVNHWTMDMGEPGRQALSALLDRAAAEGLVPKVGELVLV
jgi:1,4-dihydroxy-6-naphthoate synthase